MTCRNSLSDGGRHTLILNPRTQVASNTSHLARAPADVRDFNAIRERPSVKNRVASADGSEPVSEPEGNVAPTTTVERAKRSFPIKGVRSIAVRVPLENPQLNPQSHNALGRNDESRLFPN